MDWIFGLDASTPVCHCLDQLADLFARTLITQVHLLVKQFGGLWHQYLGVRYHDCTNASEHSSQDCLRVRRSRFTQDSTHNRHRLVPQGAATSWSRRPVDRVSKYSRYRAIVLRSGDQEGV